MNWEYRDCRTCESYPKCDGCNIYALIKALDKFDFNEHHSVVIPDKVVHAKCEALEEDNEKMRSALRKFCFHTLCSQCPFRDESWVCNLSKFIEDKE